MRLVKFQHTIFAMPFALMAFAYAMWKYALAEVCPVPLWWCVPLVQVVLCMVFARNTAMGFNRWADRLHRCRESPHGRSGDSRRR